MTHPSCSAVEALFGHLILFFLSCHFKLSACWLNLFLGSHLHQVLWGFPWGFPSLSSHFALYQHCPEALWFLRWPWMALVWCAWALQGWLLTSSPTLWPPNVDVQSQCCYSLPSAPTIPKGLFRFIQFVNYMSILVGHSSIPPLVGPLGCFSLKSSWQIVGVSAWEIVGCVDIPL